MGRARIIHNYGEGKYAIEVSLDVSRIQRERDKLARQIAELEPTLPGLAATYDLARLEYEQTYAEMIVAIQVGAGTDAQKNKQLAVLSKKLVEQGKRMLLAGHEYDSARLKLLCLQSRLSELNDLPAARNVDAWCADYSDELEIGTIVGTIDVARQNFEYNRDWVFRPCYGQTTYYDPKRDGILQDTEAATPAAAFLNFALNPGVSKWMPRYRVATVTAVYPETDRVDVDLRAAYTARLDVNQTERLEQVPVTYMDCNAAVFEEGDDVVVWFNGDDWNDPYVIGFEHDPKFLAPYIRIWLRGYDAESDQLRQVRYSVLADAQTGDLVILPGLGGTFTDAEFNALYTANDASEGYLNKQNADYVVEVSDVRMLGYEPDRVRTTDNFSSTSLPVCLFTGNLKDGISNAADVDCSTGATRVRNTYGNQNNFDRLPSQHARTFYRNAYESCGENLKEWYTTGVKPGGQSDSGRSWRRANTYTETLNHATSPSTLQTLTVLSYERITPYGPTSLDVGNRTETTCEFDLFLDDPLYADNPKLSEPFVIGPQQLHITQNFTNLNEQGEWPTPPLVMELHTENVWDMLLTWKSLGGTAFSVRNQYRGHERSFWDYRSTEAGGEFIRECTQDVDYTCGFFRQAAACGKNMGSCGVAVGVFRYLTIEWSFPLWWSQYDPRPGDEEKAEFSHGATTINVEVMFSPEKLALKNKLRNLPAIEASLRDIITSKLKYERTYDDWIKRDGNACNVYKVECGVEFVRIRRKNS